MRPLDFAGVLGLASMGAAVGIQFGLTGVLFLVGAMLYWGGTA